MTKTTQNLLAASALALLTATTVQAQVGVAGRQLDVIRQEFTPVNVPSVGGAEFGRVELAGIRWDPRCTAVNYTFNSSQGANPGTASEIPPAVLAATVQTGLDRWNDNPSSFIEMNITNLEERGLQPRTFDFVNEVTFVTSPAFTALASSPSTSLLADATFSPGDDLDGDADSDVYDPAVEGINVCSDVDGDGDIEFPAGFYEAGTILENDVQFNSNVTWELNASNTGGADVDAVSTHEFGHSHGISHALNNQTSPQDGTGTTMFPFISINEGASELATRDLHPDDLAQSAILYPEGSAASGPGALQPGDVAFDVAYDVVTGTVTDSAGDPVIGANVRIETASNGALVTEAYAGTSVIFRDINDLNGNGSTTDLFAFEEAAVNGDFRVPAPKNRSRYIAAIQAADGSPAGPGGLTTNVTIGSILGDTNFVEEFYSGRRESSTERNGDRVQPLIPRQGTVSGIDFVTDDVAIVSNAGDSEFAGTGAVFGQTRVAYADRFEREDVLAALEGGDLHSFAFEASVLENFLTPRYSKASIVLGEVDGSGNMNIVSRRDLASETGVAGQDEDLTRVDVVGRSFEARLSSELRRNPNADVYIVVEANNADIGPSGFPNAMMGLDAEAVGTSFLSFGGSPFRPFGSGTWVMELRFQAD